MATLGTRLYTWLHGHLVGTDQFGNRYYREKGDRRPRRGAGMESRERRWVIYKGESEASKVPPEWHGWLHHTVKDPPPSNVRKYPWQKEHVPNLTGTPFAYRPRGSLLRLGPENRSRATGDYEPWTPE